MHAMILAAGRGERMRPLTDRTPKVLLEVGGKPLLQWHVENLHRAGFDRIVINHAWLGEQIEQRLGDGSRFGVRIAYSPEGQALETAGGIAMALALIGADPFIVVNGDIFTDLDFSDLLPRLRALSARNLLAHVVLVDNPPHHPHGDFALEHGRVYNEQPRLTFAGIGVYRPELLAAQAAGRFSIVPILRAGMREGKISGEHFTGRWSDIGTPRRLGELDRQLRAE